MCHKVLRIMGVQDVIKISLTYIFKLLFFFYSKMANVSNLVIFKVELPKICYEYNDNVILHFHCS